MIEEINLTRIIQEAMGSMTTETVGGIRVQSMNADRAISRVVERLLRRTTDDSPSSGPPDLGTDEPREPR